MRRPPVRPGVGIAALSFAALVIVVVVNSLPWVGRTFPGFMLLANRVVPSIGLPHWAEGQTPTLFQQQVRAVDGALVSSSSEIYAIVGGREAGHRFSYRMRSFTGDETTHDVPSSVFGVGDWLLLFGAYLVNGALFVAIGLLVFALRPERPASAAVLSATVSTGLFVLTAIDLYGPHVLFRLHVLAECAMGAAFCHVALVFPTERLRDRRRSLLTALYGGAGLLALAYEALLEQPAAYTILHLTASALQVVGCAAMIGVIVHDFFVTPSPLVRRRVGIVALGASAGLVVPALLWAASATLGGGVSLNTAAFTAFLFPMSLAYAVIQRDLFEIDVVLRRSITYTLVVLSTAGLYILVLGVMGWAFELRTVADRSPATLVALNVALLFGLAPIRSRVQTTVDFLFFRRIYDPQEAVAGLGRALENTRDVGQASRATTQVLERLFFPRCCLLLEVGHGGALRPTGETVREPAAPASLPAAVLRRLEAGRAISRYEWEDDDAPVAAFWERLGGEVLVPVRDTEGTSWVIALGIKESGRSYNLHDSALLETMARQVALAMDTARAFGELEQLNADLERQVEVRTHELGFANQELEGSVVQLRQAYALLEQSQRSLVRADRLATLGRLAAGIAHEVNTPLGAVMNALQLIQNLAREYTDSIGDPGVTAEDHRQIAAEIGETASSAARWTEGAAAFVRRVKGHSRAPLTGERTLFTVAKVVDEVRGLLGHRLRLSSCSLAYTEQPDGIELVGDPTPLSHLLMNLLQNAIEAYDEQHAPNGRIEVNATRHADGVVTIEVRDFASGVPAEIAERIFDELFTTKEAGTGTGLGLWIARNLVEQSFGGELSLLPVDGPGTCFRVVLPGLREEHADGSAGSTSPRPGQPSAAELSRL